MSCSSGPIYFFCLRPRFEIFFSPQTQFPVLHRENRGPDLEHLITMHRDALQRQCTQSWALYPADQHYISSSRAHVVRLLRTLSWALPPSKLVSNLLWTWSWKGLNSQDSTFLGICWQHWQLGNWCINMPERLWCLFMCCSRGFIELMPGKATNGSPWQGTLDGFPYYLSRFHTL